MITLIVDNKYKLNDVMCLVYVSYTLWCCNGSQFVNSSDSDTMVSNRVCDMNVKLN